MKQQLESFRIESAPLLHILQLFNFFMSKFIQETDKLKKLVQKYKEEISKKKEQELEESKKESKESQEEDKQEEKMPKKEDDHKRKMLAELDKVARGGDSSV